MMATGFDPEDRPPGDGGPVAAGQWADRRETAGDAEKIAMALPRSPTGTSHDIASAAGNMKSGKAPCTTRQKMIHGSARSPVGVAPHNAEALAKPITPT